MNTKRHKVFQQSQFQALAQSYTIKKGIKYARTTSTNASKLIILIVLHFNQLVIYQNQWKQSMNKESKKARGILSIIQLEASQSSTHSLSTTFSTSTCSKI